MSLEKREGVLDQLTEKGIVLSGERLSTSKWFEGEPPTKDALGHQILVLVDKTENWQYLKRIIRIGDKVPGWKPPERLAPAGSARGGFGGGFRRGLSPEEIALKREERSQIARSVAVDRAITMTEKGTSLDRVVPLAHVIEEYLRSGKFPSIPDGNGNRISPEVLHAATHAQAAPEVEEEAPEEPALPSHGQGKRPRPESVPSNGKPRKVAGKAVNALFNEARRVGLAANWKAFAELVSKVSGNAAKTPYDLTEEDFDKVEAHIQQGSAGSRVA